MSEHNDFGKLGEEFAAKYLEENGYKIIVKNYRFQKAEIDIIAEKEDKVVIVEVKTRATDAFAEPQDAVNKKKIKLIVSAANHFLEENNKAEEVRFDIISVLPDEKGKLQINHIENAFEAFDAN